MSYDEEMPIEEPAPAPEVDVDIEAEVPEGPSADELQNEIISHNIEAMKDIATKLDDLDGYIQTIDTNMNNLNAKVKEVEEPTNVQKMMAQKDVSYPFYLNLNDYWKNNWFEQQRNEAHEKGIKATKLTYVWWNFY